MRLDRNESGDGTGKYAIVDMREIRRIGGVKNGHNRDIAGALALLELNGLIDYGEVGTEGEFFLMRLKDKYALKGLQGYFDAVTQDDPTDTDYAQDILDMTRRAGPNSQWCKKPD